MGRIDRHTLAVVCALLAMAACGRSSDPPPRVPDPDAGDAAAREWRVKHEADYRRDWVSVAGLHVLKPGRNRAGSAAGNDIVLPASAPATLGVFELTGQRVRFEPAPGAGVRLNDEPVTAARDLRDDAQRGADELVVGDTRLVVHVSGGNRAVRVRDPNGPLAKAFAGFAWFPIDARYRVVGRFIKDPQPERRKVVNTYGDVDEYTTEGVVEFHLLGQTLRLRPFTTRPGRFYFVFRDASSGQETYETARFLYSDLLPDGTTVLDFNIAYNPPCAFNPYTTCPIPLRENRLPVKILAGEKAYSPQRP
ncbi:MAG TPA: DUF1684 domain-containing protein [Vicinamibacterales bacterium]|nr:DUF1684 domain-containing protein [Vicinamibacterales bacterium]